MIALRIRFLQQSAVAAFLSVLAVNALLFIGCGGSSEVEKPSPTIVDSLQASVDSMITENVRCKSQVSRLEQENRNLVAQRAELEAKLAEAKAPPPPPPTLRTSDPQTEYDRGLSLARQKNYQEAEGVFMGLLNSGVPEELESNCPYWIGECYYGMKGYKDALTHFEHVQTYKRSTKKDDAQLMIANCYNRMRDKERAKQEYQKLIDQYPASEYVQRAKDELAKIK